MFALLLTTTAVLLFTFLMVVFVVVFVAVLSQAEKAVAAIAVPVNNDKNLSFICFSCLLLL